MATENQGESAGFLSRYGVIIAVLSVAAAGAYGVSRMLSRDKSPSPVRAPEPQVVRITPPPPPPPPPKTPEPKPEEPKAPDPTENKMIDQEPVAAAEPTPAETAPADAPMGTSIAGTGDDGFGLAYSKTGGGNTIGGTGTGSGTGGASAGRWGRYAAKVQSRIVDALAGNKRTRDAELAVKVRVWADASGRVSRATISPTTGDAELDRALRDEVLTGLSLGEAPPAGMPMPIVIRIAGRRP